MGKGVGKQWWNGVREHGEFAHVCGAGQLGGMDVDVKAGGHVERYHGREGVVSKFGESLLARWPVGGHAAYGSTDF